MDEVNNFQPNGSPIIRNVEILDSDYNVFTPGGHLLPNDRFLICVEADEPESENVEFLYSSDITGSDEDGIFSNKVTVRQDVDTFIGNATYQLTDVGTLPPGQNVTISITVRDISGAQTVRDIYLGPVKPPPIMTELNATGLTYSPGAGTPIQIKWEAISDGLYQYYFRTDNSTRCIKDLIEQPIVLSYTAGVTQITSSTYTSGDNQFCIVIYDGLGQWDSLEYINNAGTWERSD
ncbi:hypothetical protein ACFL20_03770 [Spirochaetota bacterium]